MRFCKFAETLQIRHPGLITSIPIPEQHVRWKGEYRTISLEAMRLMITPRQMWDVEIEDQDRWYVQLVQQPCCGTFRSFCALAGVNISHSGTCGEWGMRVSPTGTSRTRNCRYAKHMARSYFPRLTL